MFRNTFQGGLLTVFFSGGANPLKIWDVHKQSGYIQCYLDPDIKAMVMEIGSTNVSTTYISSPIGNVVFGITLPFLVMIVKNLKKYFTFEVTILDDTKVRRRFRVSNFQSSTKVLPFCTSMPICLADGWNQIQFNLADFTQRAYSRQYMETLKLKINANILLRRIYFADRLVPEEELPTEYKLYFPVSAKQKSSKTKLQQGSKVFKEKENLPPTEKQPSSAAVQATGPEKTGSQTDATKLRQSITEEATGEHKMTAIGEGELEGETEIGENETVTNAEEAEEAKAGEEIKAGEETKVGEETKAEEEAKAGEEAEATAEEVGAETGQVKSEDVVEAEQAASVKAEEAAADEPVAEDQPAAEEA